MTDRTKNLSSPLRTHGSRFLSRMFQSWEEGKMGAWVREAGMDRHLTSVCGLSDHSTLSKLIPPSFLKWCSSPLVSGSQAAALWAGAGVWGAMWFPLFGAWSEWEGIEHTCATATVQRAPRDSLILG